MSFVFSVFHPLNGLVSLKLWSGGVQGVIQLLVQYVPLPVACFGNLCASLTHSSDDFCPFVGLFIFICVLCVPCKNSAHPSRVREFYLKRRKKAGECWWLRDSTELAHSLSASQNLNLLFFHYIYCLHALSLLLDWDKIDSGWVFGILPAFVQFYTADAVR